MAADVSSLLRLMNGGDANEAGDSTPPITRDLLGRCCTVDSQELDLDLQVPSGWEKRLDLKSGKVYFQRCNSPNTSSVTSDGNVQVQCSKPVAKLDDLNSPPPTKRTLNLFDDPSLNLPLTPMPTYQSVCTLDKVKSALERAEKESGVGRKRSRSESKPSSPISYSSSSTKEGDLLDLAEQKPSTPVASGCPSCLMYVLISRSNPRCPRCKSIVPVPAPAVVAPKKPRLDLNISL